MPFIDPQLLAMGTFSPDDLYISTGPSNRLINEEIEAKVDSLWQAKLAQARFKDQVCYNGGVYRLNKLVSDERALSLDFAEIEFKTFSCLANFPEYYTLGDAYFCKNCHTSATVRTSDDRYLMVELSGTSLNHNTIDLLGGVLEASPALLRGNDLFASQYKEMKEEGCVQESDIELMHLRMVYLGQRTSVGFYFEVSLNISAADAILRFECKRNDPDVHALLHLSRDEYLIHLKNHSSANKRLLAKVLTLT